MLQVNLESCAYRVVHERIANDEISIDLFDDASSHIFRLMANDSFVRFQNQRKNRTNEILTEISNLGLV